jgi:hypothetical protein
MLEKIMFIPLFLIICSIVEAQTVVIARKTKDAIYVGADSKKSGFTYMSSGKIITDTSSMCKIITVGEKFNMAFLGWNISESIEAGKKACGESQNFNEAIDKYLKSYVEYLADKLWNYYETNKPLYDSIVANRRNSLSEVVFFGYEADTAFLTLVILTVKDSLDGFAINPVVGVANPLFGGKIAEILEELKTEKTWKKGTVKAINKLISKQSKNHPMQVGGPIDILKITRKGRMWIQRKQMCQ